jgi:hypothetical protein
VAFARELKRDAVVDEPLTLEALSGARLGEEVDDALLDHAGSDARLDVLTAPVLENHRLDALALQEVAQREPGWPGADDAHLGACGAHGPSSGGP